MLIYDEIWEHQESLLKVDIENSAYYPFDYVDHEFLDAENVIKELTAVGGQNVQFIISREDFIESIWVVNKEGKQIKIDRWDWPKEFRQIPNFGAELLDTYLKNAYIKIVELDEDAVKLYINQKGLGGMKNSKISQVDGDNIELEEKIDSDDKNNESPPQTNLRIFNQQLDNIIEDEEFDEYLNILSNNPLITSIKDHVSLISGEKVVENYGTRKAVILFTLFAGATISTIGSLTFLVGEKFPEEFAHFISNTTDDHNETLIGIGKYLAWSNVAVEALFYTWTISGILPSFQPTQSDTLLITEKPSYFQQFCSKLTSWKSWLPSFGEWSLATASALPLTLLSYIDQEEEEGSFKYAVIASIGFVTLASNKFFLSLTHSQFKGIWTWLKAHWKTDSPSFDTSFLGQVKSAVLESTICANEKLKHLPKKEFKDFVTSLKDITQTKSDLENPMLDERWVNLTSSIFNDLSFAPAKVNKAAIVLVPSFGVFTALSWLGLIATVPEGIEEKLSSSPALQYSLAVIAGIPLIEIGLSMGGSFGLKLSKIGDGTHSISENLNSCIERFSGYSIITLAGLGSFATTATLTIQQFDHIPALTWFLLPSAILGMDLINIASGIELWDEFLVGTKTQFNQDKALFVKHVKFLQDFQKKIETTPAKEVAAFVLSLSPNTQRNIMQFLPNMPDQELSNWKSNLINALRYS